MDGQSSGDGWIADDGARLSRRSFVAGTAGFVIGAGVASRALPVSAASVEPGASYFVPMVPARLCDTRNPKVGVGFRRLDSRTIRTRIGGVNPIPAGAVAAVVTLTGVNRNRGGNWWSAYPSGSPYRGTSSLNSDYAGQAVANLVSVKLGRGTGDANGSIDVRCMAAAETIVDIAGYYMPTASPVRSGRFVPLQPFRALDTRDAGKRLAGGRDIVVDLETRLPRGAIAVVANITVDQPVDRGFLTAFPVGVSPPTASCLNYDRGDIRAASVIVKVGTDRGVTGIRVYSMSATHVIVDVAGFITGEDTYSDPSSDGLFVPVEPERIHDSRVTHRRIWPGGTTTLVPSSVIRSRGAAVAMNVTATSTIGAGFFTALAAGTGRGNFSSLNAHRPQQTVANHVFSRVSSQGVWCYSQSGGHIVGDVTGWFTGKPTSVVVPAPYNPPPPIGPLPYIVSIPRLGLTRWVFGDDNSYRVVNAGHTWHWTGTGLCGQGTNIVLFGHRTEHGGPYRYQHSIRGGDMLHLLTSDQRRYNYQMVAEYLSTGYPNDILGKTRLVGGETVSIVSCSKTNRLPTDTRFRLISTFRLIGWDDLG